MGVAGFELEIRLQGGSQVRVQSHIGRVLFQNQLLHAAVACLLLWEPKAWSHHMHKIETLQQDAGPC